MAAKFNHAVPCVLRKQDNMSDKKRGRKAASSAEKPMSVYDAITDDKVVVHTKGGTAFTKEMKKDLFKQMGLVKTT